MKLKYYWNLWTGKTKASHPARLTWSNIKAVIQAFWRKKQMEIDGFSVPQHIYEQIIWRRTEVIAVSPSCWDTGTCRVCGCEILGKTMEDRECSAAGVGEKSCYPAMMKKDEWKQYKLSNHIKLFN